MTISWDDELLAQRCNPELRGAMMTGGRTVTGREQRILTDAGLWEVTYTLPLNTRTRVHAYRAMIARLRDGEDINAKIFDCHRPGLFGNSSGEVVFDAALRATSIQINWNGSDLTAGQHFSIANRLYRIKEITSETQDVIGVALAISGNENWDDSAIWVDDWFVTATLTITPPLRQAITIGQNVLMENLSLRCVIRDIEDGDLDLTLLKYGSASLTLIESI